MKRLSDKEARKIMKAANFDPIDEYVNSSSPWKSKCKICGNIVFPSLNTIKRRGHSCKFCSKNFVLPESAEALFLSSGYKPMVPYPGSKKPWKSRHIKCGKIVSPKYNTIQSGKGGCFECGLEISSESRKLPQAEIEKRLNKVKITALSRIDSTDSIFEYRCDVCGSIGKTTIHRLVGKKGCPKCGISRGADRRRTSQVDAIKIMKLSKFIPLDPFVNSHSPWRSECAKCGNISYPTLKTVKNNESGCAYCKGLRVVSEEVVAKIFEYGFKPLEPYKSTHKPWKLVCVKCGKVDYFSHSRIISRGQRCRYCSTTRPKYDEDDVIKFLIKKDFSLLGNYRKGKNNNKAVHLKCGRTMPIDIAYLKRGGIGCAFCSNTLKIDSKIASALMLENGYKTLAKYVNSHHPWKSRHLACGNVVNPTFGQIKQGLGGCRYCSNWGFNYGEFANLYLITNVLLNAHKIGISNPQKIRFKDRVAKHEKLGWVVYKVWDFEIGKNAEMVETEVLKILRKELSIPVFLSKEDMPQAGHTETVDADRISLKDLERLVNKTIKLKKLG